MNPGKVTFLTIILLLLFSAAAHAADHEDPAAIRQTAEAWVRANIDGSGFNNVAVRASSVDGRLKLARCGQSLEAFSRSVAVKAGRITVGVRCKGGKPWTLYVPVAVNATVSVPETARILPRGSILGAGDIRMVEKSINGLPARYVSDSASLVGMELTRPVTEGTVLTLNMLKERKLIQKGQEVIILANGPNFEVRMSGTALDAGTAGDLIPVRNSNSGRTIEAKIIDASSVEVKL